MAVGEDPNLAEITSSILQSSSGENSGGVPITTTAPSKPSDDSDELSFEHYVDQEKEQLKEDYVQLKHNFEHLIETLINEREDYKKEQRENKQERDIFLQEHADMKEYLTMSRKLMESMRSDFQQQLRTQSTTDKPIDTTSKISSPIQKLLHNYDNLDNDTKKSLFQVAMTTDNLVLQRTILQLQESKISTSASLQAKLAKELITLAEKYKVPELSFDTKATKRRANYYLWSSKLRPILAMFPQTNKVLHDGNITSYDNPNDVGNKALYLQRTIKKFEGFGDKALSFIKIQCANISSEDTHHFHHLFTILRIKDNESATNFFKCFTFALTEAEAAGNCYSDDQLVSSALAGLTSTNNSRYETALQLYRLEREQDSKTYTLAQLEKKFFGMDKQTARDSALTRIALGHAAQSHRLHHTNSKRGRSTSQYSTQKLPHVKRQHRYNTRSQADSNMAKSRTKGGRFTCYNCNEPGHIAPNCPHPKRKSNYKSQVSAATTKSDEIACAANTRIIEDNDNIQATQEASNTYVQRDDTLTMYILNDLYVTLHFEAYSFFNEPHVTQTEIH